MPSKTQTLVQEMRLEQITGFSYPFCLRLLNRLKLMTAEEIFENWNPAEPRFYLTLKAAPVVHHLLEQLKISEQASYSPAFIDEIVEAGREFLALFEEKH